MRIAKEPPQLDLRPLLQQMSDTQRDTIQQLARSLQALKPAAAKPCTLKIHRDARGYIDSIDLIPQE
ncbi:MAG: hypothetical protein HQL47_03660 [Gammaproteobacteria bacterium]|nr:hypothetical protein [Gammaproteobacteria bacterium]